MGKKVAKESDALWKVANDLFQSLKLEDLDRVYIALRTSMLARKLEIVSLSNSEMVVDRTAWFVFNPENRLMSIGDSELDAIKNLFKEKFVKNSKEQWMKLKAKGYYTNKMVTSNKFLIEQSSENTNRVAGHINTNQLEKYISHGSKSNK